jgi:hypothetical protein
MKFVGKALLFFSLLGVITFCLFASFCFINVESTITLLIFSFLFGTITSQLNGTVIRKIGLLAVGNILGLFWNLVFYQFASVGTSAFGEIFEIFYVMIFPFLNMLWIVSFWSLSMGYFSKVQEAVIMRLKI